MLWNPNEVLAYVKDDQSLENDVEKRENKLNSKTAAFGGLCAWPKINHNFVLIAENSEILGPNPIFTIPTYSKEIDLNALSTRILSADYQGLSNKKTVSLKHTQLLMPDIFQNLHAAVTYFVLFDSEARGFIRPTCVAFFTSDKNKLICLAEPLLKALSEVAAILQHCNMLHTVGDLKIMLQDLNNPKDANDVPKDIIKEDIVKDMEDILNIIETYKGNDMIDKKLSYIIEKLNSTASSSKIELFCSPSSCINKVPSWKNKIQHSHLKSMKNLYLICGNGITLGLYHLYMMYKHFRRKYENIVVSETFSDESDEKLYFGACVKLPNLSDLTFGPKECALSYYRTITMPTLESEDYFMCLDRTFEKVILDFIDWQKNSLEDSDQQSSLVQSFDISDVSTDPESVGSSSSGYLSTECETKDCINTDICQHIVSLENIWDSLDDLETKNPGCEAAFLEILKLFDDTQKLLFSILTRTPVIIISTPEENCIAQNFIKSLSIFIPRRRNEMLFVDLDRREPLRPEHFNYIAAANVCIRSKKDIEEILPSHSLHSLCILNLRDGSISAPPYSGIILTNIDERFRILPLEGPAFPILVGILCEVQNVVEWWLMVTSPTIDSSIASSSILSRGFSRLDVQIIMNLSKLCRS